MRRERFVTLHIVTEEGRPEDWNWDLIAGSPNTEISVVNVEKVN